MAIGSSTFPVDTMDTGLGFKLSNGNLLLTVANTVTAAGKTFPADSGNDAKFTVIKTFTILEADSPGILGETGIFDANNNMFARTVFPGGGIPITTGDKFTIEWTLETD